MLPMNGLGMIRQLRDMEGFHDVAIIITSARVFANDQNRAIETGANAFLPKPLAIEQLLTETQKQLKLEWIYGHEHREEVIQSDTELIVPPAAELETLFELAVRGNIRGIVKQATILEELDHRLAPFTSKLRQFVKGFQEKEILEFIGQYRSVNT